MMEGLAYLREMNVASVLLRLTVAMLFGGFIGLERSERRPAGFRTYMLVCLGAALTMLLSQYESYMVTHAWHETAMEIGLRTDVSRFGAQVINGIGFLGAGTIIVTGKQEVKGLTTAAGLWASACMGLAIGAGFYECVLLGFLLILLTNRLLPFVEDAIIESARNMNIYVEFQTLDNLGDIIARIKSQGGQIYEVDLDRGRRSGPRIPARCSPFGCPAGTTTSGSWRRSPSWRASTPLMKSEGGARLLPIFDGVRDVTVLSTTLRMLLAVVCGGLIGLEREYKRRPAGSAPIS
ncbi:MAG: MgtC/SapB family protein [Dysosmobacter welbionis]